MSEPVPVIPDQEHQAMSQKLVEALEHIRNHAFSNGYFSIAAQCDYARAALASAESQSQWRPPEGWVLVPKEPTLEMLREGARRFGGPWWVADVEARSAYRAMLSAAPSPPET